MCTWVNEAAGAVCGAGFVSAAGFGDGADGALFVAAAGLGADVDAALFDSLTGRVVEACDVGELFCAGDAALSLVVEGLLDCC